MTAHVLDTSVAIAWYLPEAFSGSAKIWRERFLQGKIRLLVPDLHFIEFANVLRTYVRRGEIKKELAGEIYQLHLDAPLEVVNPSVENVLQTALEFEATAYDAVFIQLALQQGAPLLTGERTTTPWVAKLKTLAQVVK